MPRKLFPSRNTQLYVGYCPIDNRTGEKSIYGKKFEGSQFDETARSNRLLNGFYHVDENPELKHHDYRPLSVANAGKHTNGSQSLITTGTSSPSPTLDKRLIFM
jgi:cyclophilin family peptidyl-prolyl cis-trans isomerase